MPERTDRSTAIALTGLLILTAACGRSRESTTATTVFTYTSPLWYEEIGRYYQISANGARAIYGTGSRGRVIELATATVDSAAWNGALGTARGAAFDPSGALVRLGALGAHDALAWIGNDSSGPLQIPAGALPRWSSEGRRLAWFQPGDSAVTIVAGSDNRRIQLPGGVTGLNWNSQGDALFATTLQDADGLTTLVRIDTAGTSTVVREKLDASPAFNTIAVTPKGDALYLALAGDPAPDVKIKHDPEAPHRDLDIYWMSLPSGQLQRVAGDSGDDFAPALVNGALFWTHNDPQADVVVLPIAGGEPKSVADHGFWPRWSPDGHKIAFTRAYFRISDYGLDMDGWVVDVDSTGNATAPPRAWITGYGEDMGPVWSPDEKWVAYHSHRSANPVPLYGSPGRTDDQWLQLTAGGPEIRVTDFGFEVAPPAWSPDGRQLLFDSWSHDGIPRMARPWITTIDPATGRTVSSKQVPLPKEIIGINGEAWSPDGKGIAVIQRVDETHQALWTLQLNGSSARKLVEFNGYTIGGVTWTPDGRSLIYAAVADDHTELFMITSDGGTPVQLTHGPANVMHPHVSSDGRFITASRILWRKELRKLPLQ